MNTRNTIIIIILLACHLASTGQKIRLFQPQNQLHFLHDSLIGHSTFPPVLLIDDYDNLTEAAISSNISNSFVHSNLVDAGKKNLRLIANPVISNAFTYASGEEATFTDSELGLHAILMAGRKLSFQGLYSYNITRFPEFIQSKTDTLNYIPHHGNYAGSTNHYHWHNLNVNLLYSPFPYLNLQAGIGKHFYGNGYRSLFISQNANAYPYVSAEVDVWKLKYNYLIGFLKDVHNYARPFNLKSKYAAFHYLNWDITDFIRLNLFESIIWAADDSTTQRGFDINYLNPVIFFRPVEFSTGSPDNVLLGIGLQIRFLKNNYIYGQFLLDEFNLELVRQRNGWWGVKYGYQAGFKSHQLLSIPGLFTQFEVNTARPFTYSHAFTSKSYGNHLQPLAHPLGSNFVELLNYTSLKKNRLKVQNRFFWQQYGNAKQRMNYGNDVYLSNNNRAKDYNNELLQPETITMAINDFSVGYIVNPFWHLELTAGLLIRKRLNDQSESYTGFYFGLLTNLSRRDFWDGRYQ